MSNHPIKHIVFFHPELSIGGAEKVIVEAATVASRSGYRVSVITGQIHAQHEEMLRQAHVDVVLLGAFIMRRKSSRLQLVRVVFHAIWSVLSYRLLTWRRSGVGSRVDLMVYDLSPHVLGLATMLFWKSKQMIYCHFPDQMLGRGSSIPRAIYRSPLDWMERRAFRRADLVLANSMFTRKAILSVFGEDMHERVDIVWPGVADTPEVQSSQRNLVLCVGRFSPEKNLELAVDAFSRVNIRYREEKPGLCLCLAGACDDRSEAYLSRLHQLAVDQKVAQQLTIVKNASSAELTHLYDRAIVLIHPAIDEHFGIVPVEAMLRQVPVVAVDSGGPRETVVNSETGFLRRPDPVEFSEAVEIIVSDKHLASAMGINGRLRARKLFSLEKFETDFLKAVGALLGTPPLVAGNGQ